MISKKNLSITSSAAKVKGASLIEAVISILIFSVGALGLAAMQLSALSASGDNQQRSLAIWKAQEFADRIRSNPEFAATYVTKISNSSLNNIGKDSALGVVACEAADPFKKPANRCSDYVGGTGAVADCKTGETRVDFDIWEVFCEPTTGVAISGGTTNEGSVGLTNLEVVLRQNVEGTDGNDDMELYFEWVSRESDAVENITNDTGTANNVKTDLCGRTNVLVDSRLDIYCMRFRP